MYDGHCAEAEAAMEILRRARNAWGQEILLGVSWDLIWVFVGIGAFAIAVHVAWVALMAPRLQKRTGSRARGRST